MTNRLIKDARTGNITYKRRHIRKSAKGQGIYADQLPGNPRGVHNSNANVENPCHCGRCG